MPTKTFSVRHGVDVANTIVIDSSRNLSNINSITVGEQNLFANVNAAANTVRVSQNSGSTLSAKQLNFVNTSTVTVTVTENGGNANITFTSVGGGGADPAAANTVMVSANSGSTLSQKKLNFVNTSTVTVSVTDAGDGNANVSFISVGGGGPGGPGSTRDSFTGDGACTTFALSVEPTNENYTIVFVGGVLQGDIDFNLSAANIVFTNAPPTSTPIEVYTIGAPAPAGNNQSATFTTDGVTNTYALGFSVVNNNNILVSLDGITMIPTTDYTVSGSNMTLTFMPPSNISVEVRTL